ncbi:hypothetical protein BDZ90DRAFT_232691 [Jaminaea rosea]|uniref:SURF1-like protein n=1 Tax=Jaminaea rosea TaxID=1569628 RepID=A0A316UPA5_9BASI|nr:hypothetical protein BDZ90DRAFT_232691 [Jaminaea rosea]PWN27132.1 hypothetical protein BDZ90DRAFT_232691 [Jaminaea rosea]
MNNAPRGLVSALASTSRVNQVASRHLLRPSAALPALSAPPRLCSPTTSRFLSTSPPRPQPSSASGSTSSSTSPDEFESLHSSRYRGQGAKPDRPPWYRSPTLLLLGFMPIFTFGLGVWQIKRLGWKLNLIEELEWKLKKEPIGLPKNINLSVLPSFDFRLVSLSGHFDHSRVMFLGPRVREGTIGYHVVVPFMRDGGGDEVMVDRGFVSEKSLIGEGSQRRLKKDESVAPTGHVTLTALLPRISPPNYFTPPNEPQNNRWFHADPEAMAQWASTSPRGAAQLSSGEHNDDDGEDSYTPSAGVASSVKKMLGVQSGDSSSTTSSGEHRVLPVFLEEIFEGYDGGIRVEKGIPVGRAATIELRNQHAVYAATWFSLSAAMAGMFALLVRRRR